MWIVHCLAVELRAVIHRVRSTLGEGSMVALPIIQMMVDMAVEVVRSVEPGSSADKYAACEPFRAVVSVRRAIVRRLFVVPIRANWWRANLDGYLRGGPVR